MRWWNCLGVGLQVGGLLGAMYLLARLREMVTQKGVWPLTWFRAAWRHTRVFGRWLLRRKPAPITLDVHSSVMVHLGGSAHISSARGTLPDDLTAEAQVAWVAEHVRDVERKHNERSEEVWRQASAQEDALKATRAHAEKEIREAVGQVRSEFRQLVGKDVAWEIGSLAVVAVGIVLAAV